MIDNYFTDAREKYFFYRTSEGHNLAMQLFEALPKMNEQEEKDAIAQLKAWPRKNVEEAWDAIASFRGIKGVTCEMIIGPVEQVENGETK